MMVDSAVFLKKQIYGVRIRYEVLMIELSHYYA